MDRSNSDLSAPMTAHQIPWRPRSDIGIFIRALHLLDLDLSPDFPGISESTFASSSTHGSVPASQTHNLQSRIKAVEWSFYRLYQIYDAEGTRTRLGPYFPPAAPISSLNLRAAIYRWLTELKKDGVLPRETVLRKTMLDECKGEKFEELLATFAMLVLRKNLVGRARKSVKGQERSSTMEEKTRLISNRDHLVPLILAYRFTLQQSLLKRKDLAETAHAQALNLQQLRNDIKNRLESALQPEDIEELAAEEYDALKYQVEHAFAADRQWADYIFQGNPACTSLPAATQEAIRRLLQNSSPSDDSQKDTSGDDHESPCADEPMKQLQQTVLERQARVHRLELLRESLLARTEPTRQPSPVSEGDTHPQSKDQPKDTVGPRFTRHQALTLSSLVT